jgi:EAL domain-containing protein (putative c-di-GMP-specific phosphodiesterase class I)
MPADTLKIDRRFIAAIPHHRQQVKVLHTTLQLARALNLTTVAEGVETDIQRKFLAKLGFPLMQGYLFGRPAPASHWHEQLERQQPTLHEVSRLSAVESDVAG